MRSLYKRQIFNKFDKKKKSSNFQCTRYEMYTYDIPSTPVPRK